MKIATLETFVVGNPPPSFGGRYFLFVKLVTDDGIVGVGEVYAATFGPHTLARMVADVFERHVLGMDPFRIESLWRRVYGSGYTLRPDVSLMGVLSGIEIALWDIIGKACNVPVYKLWGGFRDRVPAYASCIECQSPEQRAENIAGIKAAGWRATKLRIHDWTIKEDIAQVEAVRRAVGRAPEPKEWCRERQCVDDRSTRRSGGGRGSRPVAPRAAPRPRLAVAVRRVRRGPGGPLLRVLGLPGRAVPLMPQAVSSASASPWVPGRGAHGSSRAGRTTTRRSPRASWVTVGSK